MIPLSPRSRWSLTLIALIVAVVLAAPPAASGQLTLSDETERIGPGITLRHFETLAESGWTDARVLSVDLHQKGLDVDLLTAPKVAAGAPLSDQARAAGAVAGVNGDFFDINGSNASLGFEIDSGELRKSAVPGRPLVAAVAQNRRGLLAELALDATLSFDGSEHAVTGINISEAGKNSIVVYDHEWGDHPRTAAAEGAPGTEVIVTNGIVSSVSDTPGAGTLPGGTLALVGREAGADALAALETGDPVKLSYAIDGDFESPLEFAIGGPVFLVEDGVVPGAIPGEDGPAPRTAIGFDDRGETMLLAIADGRQGEVVLGPTRLEMARLMSGLGAEDAMLLDGGGSTTLVARGLGEKDADVQNAPSDGSERSDPNGVGLFLTAGDGVAQKLIVHPADERARVFPGLHRTVNAEAIDNRAAPIDPDPSVSWSATAGAVRGRHYRAPKRARGKVGLRAGSGTATGKTTLTVLEPLRRLAPSSERIAFTDTSSPPTTLRITGSDAEGFAASIDPADMELTYDRSVVAVRTRGGTLQLVPRGDGGTILEVEVGDEVTRVPVTVGPAIPILSGIARVSRFLAGSLAPEQVAIDPPAAIDPPLPPFEPDRLVDTDGVLPSGGERFQFAALSDLELSAADQEGVPTAIQALDGIRAQDPDFVVLNGDIADSGDQADIELARRMLEDGGCNLVAAVEATPKPHPGSIPCLYVPGDRESSGTGSLDRWEAEFGPPFGTFDHRGVRFVLLNSSLGTLRRSDWEQLPMLQAAIADAEADSEIRALVVFAHHPTDDPNTAAPNQLGERKEVELIESMLSRFRADSGKGVAMIGSLGETAHVNRVDGVPYVTIPSSGKAPGRGGGWVRFGVDPGEDADGAWLAADLRASNTR